MKASPSGKKETVKGRGKSDGSQNRTKYMSEKKGFLVKSMPCRRNGAKRHTSIKAHQY